MKPKALPIKTRVNVAILAFMGPLKPGDKIRTEDVIKYCHKYVGRYIYGDTILRYMRELRDSGDIDYVIPCRRTREMVIL